MDPRQTEILHRLIDGELTREEAETVKSRIRSDPALAAHLDDLSRLSRAAGELTVLKAPRFDPASRPHAWRRFASRAWPLAAGLAAAAACVLIGIGIAGLRGQAPLPAPQQAILRLVYFAPEADSVSVIGDFNQWSGEIPLRSRGGSGYWQVELAVDPGEYHYTLILNGDTQVTDPTADYVVDDDFGSKNSVVRVGI